MSDELYKRKYERSKARVAILEAMIEDKTRELFLLNEASRTMALFAELNPAPVLRVDATGAVLCHNPAVVSCLGDGAETGKRLPDVLAELRDIDLAACIHESRVVCFESQLNSRHFHFMLCGIASEGFANVYGSDTSETKQLEIELRHAQKLESVGQLAAGVAHEINTPMQFIGDNVHFLQEAFEDLLQVASLYASSAALDPTGPLSTAAVEKINAALETADLEYLQERGPKAFTRTLDGIARVTEIVAAMKAFSHPQQAHAPCNVNEAVEVTLAVAKNEYKYIADVETDLASLPDVVCHRGDINQVLLNLVVNAAHAIQDVVGDSGERGRIQVRTQLEAENVVISVSDSGCGIPDDVRERIFDPFFTTKTVGRGTGQGLSMVHAIVVDRHGGSIDVQTEVGQGSTFFLRLPLQAEPHRGAAA